MQNFVEKTFAGGSQGATMAKVIELSTHLRVKHVYMYMYMYVCIHTHKFLCTYGDFCKHIILYM